MLFKLLEKIINQISPPKSVDWCRVVMDNKTNELINSLDIKNLNVLEISGSKWANFGFASYKNVKFPGFDICKDVLEQKFDLIIAEQVFEHILWPRQAAINIKKMLAASGFFLITTPFLIRIHNEPNDCTRWSEQGLRHFLSDAGFPINQIQSGSWGNKACLVRNLKGWVRYQPLMHSLRNDDRYPLVCWALAKNSD